MFRKLGIQLGLITTTGSIAAGIKRSTVSVAHEDKRASKHHTPSPASKTQLVAVSRASFHIDKFKLLPDDVQLLITDFFSHRETQRFNQALGPVYYRNHPNLSAAAAMAVAPLPFSMTDAFINSQFLRAPRAGKLINDVIDADYDKAAMAIAYDPSLMFEHVNFIYPNGRCERISPLKQAFKNYDTYMWKMFYERIKDNPDYVEEFLRQAQEQTTHIDLEPLFATYEEYERQRQRWLIDEITDQQLDTEWFKLGAVQQKILPAHMLKEFSREGDTWRANSAFDVTAMLPPSNCRIFDYLTNAWRALSSIISDRGWGVSFSLVRGGGELVCVGCLGASWRPWGSLAAELATFRRLFEVRTMDFAKQLSLLSQNSHISPELETQNLSSASRAAP